MSTKRYVSNTGYWMECRTINEDGSEFYDIMLYHDYFDEDFNFKNEVVSSWSSFVKDMANQRALYYIQKYKMHKVESIMATDKGV